MSNRWTNVFFNHCTSQNIISQPFFPEQKTTDTLIRLKERSSIDILKHHDDKVKEPKKSKEIA